MFAKVKYLFAIGLLFLIHACATESSTQVTNIDSSDEVSVVKEVAEIVNTATPLPATATPLPPTAKVATEQKKQGDVQSIQTESLAPEIEHNPKFQDCVGVRTGTDEDGNRYWNVRGHTLCTEGNLRVLVQDYIDALNNGDFNLVKKYIDEKSLSELTPIFEDKSKKISSDSLNLTWEDEEPPAKRGSKRASVFINVTGENFSERWLIDFIEVGEKGGGIWFITSVSYDK